MSGSSFFLIQRCAIGIHDLRADLRRGAWPAGSGSEARLKRVTDRDVAVDDEDSRCQIAVASPCAGFRCDGIPNAADDVVRDDGFYRVFHGALRDGSHVSSLNFPSRPYSCIREIPSCLAAFALLPPAFRIAC